MPDKGYSYKSSGTNSQVSRFIVGIARVRRLVRVNADQGNHYCARDYGSSASNQNSYHYSNQLVSPRNFSSTVLLLTVLNKLSRDGSYYYSNPNGSTYHNNGNGQSTYTPPSGNSQSSGGSKK